VGSSSITNVSLSSQVRQSALTRAPPCFPASTSVANFLSRISRPIASASATEPPRRWWLSSSVLMAGGSTAKVLRANGGMV
jgi:hypothetical protein